MGQGKRIAEKMSKEAEALTAQFERETALVKELERLQERIKELAGYLTIEHLASELLRLNSPVSILECRSGWRVFLREGWSNEGEPLGKNLAYSHSGGFLAMLKEAVSALAIKDAE